MCLATGWRPLKSLNLTGHSAHLSGPGEAPVLLSPQDTDQPADHPLGTCFQTTLSPSVGVAPHHGVRLWVPQKGWKFGTPFKSALFTCLLIAIGRRPGKADGGIVPFPPLLS